jgi:hypothetical protein
MPRALPRKASLLKKNSLKNHQNWSDHLKNILTYQLYAVIGAVDKAFSIKGGLKNGKDF